MSKFARLNKLRKIREALVEWNLRATIAEGIERRQKSEIYQFERRVELVEKIGENLLRESILRHETEYHADEMIRAIIKKASEIVRVHYHEATPFDHQNGVGFKIHFRLPELHLEFFVVDSLLSDLPVGSRTFSSDAQA